MVNGGGALLLSMPPGLPPHAATGDLSMWLFKGPARRSSFSSAVFLDLPLAEEWIQRNVLSGTLIRYPVNVSTYEWATALGHFTPRGDYDRSSAFIESFSSTKQDHRHYCEGTL